MKYEFNLHLFSEKLSKILIKKGMVDKKGKPNKIALYNALYKEDIITDDDCKKDRQAVTDKTRKIDNWLKGKNYPSNIADILSLCNALDCDLDYFFTSMPCETHDLEFISKETQLSSDAILYIENSSEYERLILDSLLKNGFFFDVCYAIYSYMQTYHKEITVNDGDIESEKLKDTEKMEFAEYRAAKHFSSTLINKISKDKDIIDYSRWEHTREYAYYFIKSGKYKELSKEISQVEEEWRNEVKNGSKVSFKDYLKAKGYD